MNLVSHVREWENDEEGADHRGLRARAHGGPLNRIRFSSMGYSPPMPLETDRQSRDFTLQ